MTTVLIVLVIIAAVWAAFLAWGRTSSAHVESDRRVEIARVNRERRLAEARINHLTTSAIRQLSQASAPHGVLCQCARCVGRCGPR